MINLFFEMELKNKSVLFECSILRNVKMGKNETEDEKDELLNWNENETFVTSEATSRVSDVDLLKVGLPM